MKNILNLSAILLLLASCEKNSDPLNSFMKARITGYDLNCSTCLVEFPDDSITVRKEIGSSENNFYEAVNLSKENYQPGQLIKVMIRLPKAEEFNACMTLYPTYDYKSIFVSDIETFDELIWNDTISLSYQECLNDRENQLYFCFESVVSDSRCPKGAMCFWEGNAEARFKLQKHNSAPVFFNLNTHTGFTCDTIIDGIKFTLLDISPYPEINHRIDQKDYSAKLIVERE